MEKLCETCRQPDPTQECKLCENSLCDDCVMSPPHGSFSMMEKIPADLSHTIYCRFCYDGKIEPEVLKYETLLSAAKEVFIFFKTQRKEVPLIRKMKVTMKVDSCEDRDETILRLAFMAAEQGLNAVIDTDVNYQKVRNEGYQKTKWSGSGVAAQVDENKLDRQHRANQAYERG